MAILTHLAAALSLLSVVSAFPSSVLTARSCSGPIQPKAFYLLQEGNPTTSTQVTNNDFRVSQTAGSSSVTNRDYMLVEFGATPAGSNGCELVLELSPQLKFNSQSGPSQIDVIQVTGSVPSSPSWNNVVGASPSILGGTFGTVNAVAGAKTVVNTATCANSGSGLAFVFKLSQWIEQGNTNAVTDFTMNSDSSNIFIQHNC